MTQRRKRPLPPSARRRPPDGPEPGSWELAHSPYTFEGQVEGLGRLAAGAAGRERRPWPGWALALVVLVPVAVALWGVVVALARG